MARDKMGQNKIGGIFSTISDSPFAHYTPKLKQTTVFIYRLLLGQSYEEIAEHMDTSVDNVQKIYHKAKQRILKALKLCDQHQNHLDKAECSLKANEEATGKLPKYQK